MLGIRRGRGDPGESGSSGFREGGGIRGSRDPQDSERGWILGSQDPQDSEREGGSWGVGILRSQRGSGDPGESGSSGV